MNWCARLPFWQAVVDDLEPGAVLEVGCNAAWNLMAIRSTDRGFLIETSGIEPNDQARHEAQNYGFNVSPNWWEPMPLYDLVFTSGVLIHVPPAELEATMRRIVAASRRHVVCIEYAAEQEREIVYQGQMGLMWKRPYGDLYQAMGLRLLGEAHLPPESGFDNCHYWLFGKRHEP